MEITFHDIVKMIHPDLHPEVKDPSIKMTLVIKYKSQPLALWNLAVKWGLVKGEYNITAPEAVIPKRPNTTPVVDPYEQWKRGVTTPSPPPRQAPPRQAPPRQAPPRQAPPRQAPPRQAPPIRTFTETVRTTINRWFGVTTQPQPTEVHTGWDVNNYPRRDKSWDIR